MSPEQARGEPLDARSDLFSLGAVLYEMLSGRHPFRRNSSAETASAILRDAPADLGRLEGQAPEAVKRLVGRCLEKRPEDRFQTANDLALALDVLGRGEEWAGTASSANPVTEEAESGPATSAAPVRSKRRLWLVAGLAGLLAMAAGAWLLLRPPPPPPRVVPLTSMRGIELGPSLSPDGEQVAFCWNGEKLDNFDIYLKMIGSSEVRRLTTDPAPDLAPSWSPDGRQIAFLRYQPQARCDPTRFAPGRVRPEAGRLPLGRGAAVVVSRRSLAGRGARPPREAAPGPRSGRARVRGALPRPRAGRRAPPHPAPSSSRRRLLPQVLSGRTPPGLSVLRRLLVPRRRRRARRRLRTEGTAPAPHPSARSSCPGVSPGPATGNPCSSSRTGSTGSGASRSRGQSPRHPSSWPACGAIHPRTAASRDRLVFAQELRDVDIYRFETGRPARARAGLFVRGLQPQLLAGRTAGRLRVRALRRRRTRSGSPTPTAPTRSSSRAGRGSSQGSPRWSPDGRRIAFDSQGEDGHWDIWTIDVDGGSPRRLTQGPGDENVPSWSRDGRFVYFASRREGGPPDVWRIPAAGGAEERITQGGGALASESIDGRTLLFTRTFADSPLLALPLAGGPERQLVDCVAGFAVGPGGVYYRGCLPGSLAPGGPEAPLFLRDPATGRQRLLGKLGPGGWTHRLSRRQDDPVHEARRRGPRPDDDRELPLRRSPRTSGG